MIGKPLSVGDTVAIINESVACGTLFNHSFISNRILVCVLKS
jgi:hypothetical protein